MRNIKEPRPGGYTSPLVCLPKEKCFIWPIRKTFLRGQTPFLWTITLFFSRGRPDIGLKSLGQHKQILTHCLLSLNTMTLDCPLCFNTLNNRPTMMKFARCCLTFRAFPFLYSGKFCIVTPPGVMTPGRFIGLETIYLESFCSYQEVNLWSQW